jgi:hypothetical protein
VDRKQRIEVPYPGDALEGLIIARAHVPFVAIRGIWCRVSSRKKFHLSQRLLI